MKRKIIYGLLIPLFIVGFYVLFIFVSNSNQSTFTQENQYLPLDSDQVNVEQNFVVNKQEEIPLSNNEPMPTEETELSLELPTEEEVKKQIEAFAKVYFSYDSTKDPVAYIDNSASYITEEFYQQINENPRRPIISIEKEYVKELFIEPIKQEENESTLTEKWDLGIVLVRQSPNGETTEVYFDYWLTLSPEENWKIAQVDLL